MKSFKVVELKLEHENNFIILDLIDGIIINKEKQEDPWLVEISTSTDFKDILEDLVGTEMEMLVTITRHSNEPARFKGVFNEMNEIENALSLIFNGKIIVQGPHYAEDLLSHLLDEGYEQEKLLNEFKAMMESKAEIKTSDD
ncbi:YwpF-like family protein [Salinicoccus sp. RF5]|uniref:YwpF-like family protein n=1 Tax=Salinicoccus sp. RF5 TaxID=2748874 RepID=UPI001E3E1590|nr:YwpF-like family protein [Salinicoccus sp. RF5]MCC4723154.1 YwpF-like family protein [Salinicoccus sp. RF5]